MNQRQGNGCLLGCVSVVFLTVPTLAFLFGLLLWGDEMDKTAETTGVVVALPADDPFPDSESDTCGRSVQFEVDGVVVRTTSGMEGTLCDVQPGETVPVAYDPDDLQENTAGDGNPGRTGLIIMTVAGLIIGSIVAVLVLAVRWLRKPSTVSRMEAYVERLEEHGVQVERPDDPQASPWDFRFSDEQPNVSPEDFRTLFPPPPARDRDVPRWDPSNTRSRPDEPGWYAVGDGSVEQWYNGVSWSDSTRVPGQE